MVNLSRRFKIEYEDATDGTTIIAETGQDTGAPKINRHVHIRKTNDPDILKLWLEEPDFGNTIPTDRGDFATAQNGENEPEILYKQYDRDSGSFVTQGRFYAKNSGSINSDGELAVKLYSFMKYTAKQEVDMSDSTSVESAMQKVLPSGYTVVNAGSDVSIDNFSINSTREKGYQELTRNYDFALTFTAELDANNDYKVKYEPVGQGGTVDSLVDRDQGGRFPIVDVDTGTDTFFVSGDRTDNLVVNQAIEVDGSTGNDGTYTIASLNYDSTDNETDIGVSENVSDSTADGSILPGGTTKFKSWEKDKTDSVVNKVTVEGVNKNTNNKITATAENTDTQSKVGVKSRPPVKVGYFNGTDADAESDAQDIAESYLVPAKGITELPESGRVKTAVYSDNVVNDSFQVISNRLNIDDTYTCRQQRNFWPEGATEIDFEFEQEGLEEAARNRENLRDERARLLPSQQEDVGNQSVSTGDALSNTAKTGGVGDSNDRDNNLSNVAKTGGVGDSNDRDNNLSNVAKTGNVTETLRTTTVDTDDSFFDGSLDSSGWKQVGSISNLDNDNALRHVLGFSINSIGSNADINVAIVIDGETLVFHSLYKNVGNQNTDVLTSALGDDNYLSDGTSFTVANDTSSSDYTLHISTQGSGSQTITVSFVGEAIKHSHGDDINTDNQSMGLTDDVNTDNNAMGLTDDIGTDDNLHGGGSGDDQHGGSTENNVNVNIVDEDKTDR